MDETDLLELGSSETPAERVGRLAALAQSSGLDGAVCSAQEAAMLSRRYGPEFALITPGIRLPDDSPGDQRRVVTPWDATEAGSTYLVMGRSITGAANPPAVVDSIIGRLSSSK